MKRTVEFVVVADVYGVSHGWDDDLRHRVTVDSYRITAPHMPSGLRWPQQSPWSCPTSPGWIEIAVDQLGTIPKQIRQAVTLLT